MQGNILCSFISIYFYTLTLYIYIYIIYKILIYSISVSYFLGIGTVMLIRFICKGISLINFNCDIYTYMYFYLNNFTAAGLGRARARKVSKYCNGHHGPQFVL